MTIAAIKPGDIVRVADRLAYVVDKEPGRLQIRWTGTFGGSLRWCKAREVEAHWRRAGR